MRARKIDGNQQAVVAHLRAVGYVVFVTSGLGNGFPDLAVSRRGFAALVEVKDGRLPPSERQLTPKEQQFRREWQGPYILALSPEDAHQQLVAFEAVIDGRCQHIHDARGQAFELMAGDPARAGHVSTQVLAQGS